MRTSREKGGRARPVSCASRFIAVSARFSRPSSRPASVPRNVTCPGLPDGSTVASFQSPRASPRASNPGPRLADDAGVLTVKRIGESLLQRGNLSSDTNWPVRSAARSAVDIGEVVGGDRFGVLQDVPGQERDRGVRGATMPSRTRRRSPASDAADAGSQPMPLRSIAALASRISSSLTVVTQPLLSSIERRARAVDAGLPILIAVATVSAWTGAISKPEAW